MEEQKLKRKIQLLYGIKPRESWVFSTRNRILHENEQIEQDSLQNERFWVMISHIGKVLGKYLEKPAFVMPVLALLVAGGAVWQGAAGSLPGDTFYSVRATVEQVPLRFSVDEDRSLREFALTQQRLADLKQIAVQNKVKNLPSAIQEFEANASKVSEGFLAIVENQPENALQASKQMVQLQKEKLEVEQILGTKIGEYQAKEIEDAMKKLVEYELVYLETRSFNEEQEKVFESIQALVAEEDYAEALEAIWTPSQN
jgi:hypothetical protein